MTIPVDWAVKPQHKQINVVNFPLTSNNRLLVYASWPGIAIISLNVFISVSQLYIEIKIHTSIDRGFERKPNIYWQVKSHYVMELSYLKSRS